MPKPAQMLIKLSATKMIYAVKETPFLQVSSQESSKLVTEDRQTWHMLEGWNLTHKLMITY